MTPQPLFPLTGRNFPHALKSSERLTLAIEFGDCCLTATMCRISRVSKYSGPRKRLTSAGARTPVQKSRFCAAEELGWDRRPGPGRNWHEPRWVEARTGSPRREPRAKRRPMRILLTNDDGIHAPGL